MARVLVQTPLRDHRALLSGAALIGRHWSCHVVLDHPAVPLFWVELRWSGSRWMWRCLEAEDRTVGAGACLDASWRHLARGASVRLSDGAVGLTLVEDRGPQVLLESLLTGTMLEGDACLERVDIRDDGVLVAGAASEARLRDGQVFLHDGEPFRLHLPEGWLPTETPRFSLAAAELVLEWSPHHDRAVVTVGPVHDHRHGRASTPAVRLCSGAPRGRRLADQPGRAGGLPRPRGQPDEHRAPHELGAQPAAPAPAGGGGHGRGRPVHDEALRGADRVPPHVGVDGAGVL